MYIHAHEVPEKVLAVYRTSEALHISRTQTHAQIHTEETQESWNEVRIKTGEVL